MDVLRLPNGKRHNRQRWIRCAGTGELTPVTDEHIRDIVGLTPTIAYAVRCPRALSKRSHVVAVRERRPENDVLRFAGLEDGLQSFSGVLDYCGVVGMVFDRRNVRYR